MKHYFVVAAIIIENSKILCTQRKPSRHEYISLKYEFPGGKIEDGESAQEALKREIREELELNIEVKDEFLTVEHEYPDFRLTMRTFLCKPEQTIPILKEHVNYVWLTKQDLYQLDWAAADIPIVDELIVGWNGTI